MKKMLLPAALAATMLLTACGDNSANMDKANTASSSYSMNKAMESADSYSDDSYSEENYDSSESSIAEKLSEDYKQNEVKAINRQMLVYSCYMNIDVLEFDASVDQLHELIDRHKGFIESENYNDGGDTSKWQYTDENKWKNLSAVIRIPSLEYDAFCKEAEDIGDMRKKSASVENLNTEYSDLSTTLEIYKAKEKRYIDLLAEIQDESRALSVENELTDIQIEISRIKTRMNSIENDVAYSYVNLNINEVREYKEEKEDEPDDTFAYRLKKTVSNTWDGFLGFLEGLLFVVITLLPYILLLGGAVFILLKLNKVLKVRRQKKAEAEREEYYRRLNSEKAAESAEATEEITETKTTDDSE